VLSNFSVVFVLSSSDECYYITPFYKLQPLFSIFSIFFEFFKKVAYSLPFSAQLFFKKAFIAYKYTLLFVFYTLDAKDLLFILL